MQIYRITRCDDPRLDDWFDIYQASFPVNEQMPISTFLRFLREGSESQFMLAVEEEGKVAGIIHSELRALSDGRRSYGLWYFAVREEARNTGLGARVYRDYILRAAREAGCVAVVLEVEKPSAVADADLARRRIKFYQRNGARLVTGLFYEFPDERGEKPPDEFLMVHPLEPLGDIFQLLVDTFQGGGGVVMKTGAIGLE